MSEVIKNRHEFVILFDIENGNPNGDPDAGNMPRIDPETGYGLITDVCLKRKIRNYVETVKEDEPGYSIYIKEDVPLNRSDNKAFEYLGVNEKTVKELKKKSLSHTGLVHSGLTKDAGYTLSLGFQMKTENIFSWI